MNRVMWSKWFGAVAAVLVAPSVAMAAGAAKAAEPASKGIGGMDSLIIIAVLGGLGYLLYKNDLLPGVSSGDDDQH